jgi:bifunctional DNA-binding transcriptional regulator/antitoxin component of YhaV-PrlF toxin-antitoxin module
LCYRPVEIRERFGLLPDTEVEFVVKDTLVVLRRIDEPGHRRGDRIVGRLRGRASKKNDDRVDSNNTPVRCPV